MKPLELSRGDRLALGVLLPIALLGAAVALYAMPAEKTGDFRRQPSTFFNASHGAEAAFRSLARMGHTVARLRRPLDAVFLQAADVVFVLEPVAPLAPEEADTLLDWVAEGHTAILAPGLGESFDEWFRWTSPGGAPENALIIGRRGHELAVDGASMAGIERLATRTTRRLDAARPLREPLSGHEATALWQDAHGILALRVAWGRGQLIALPDAFPVTNEGLRHADNAVWLARLAQTPPTGTPPPRIAFDEYHLGFRERAVSPIAMAKLALEPRWRPAVVHLAVAALLALLTGAVRFGPARDVARVVRRRHGELADAAGRLLREAGAHAWTSETIRSYYRAELARALGLASSTPATEVGARLQERTGEDALSLLAPAAPGTEGPREIFLTTRSLHGLLERVRHGA